MNLTKSELREMFDYTSDGNLIWLKTVGGRAVKGDVAGTVDKAGYRTVNYRGRQYRYHRVVYAWHTGEWPPEIDHKDRNRANCRIENLRPLSHSDNVANSSYARSGTGIRGVSRRRDDGRYIARIRKLGELIHLGSFNNPEQAREAYVMARKELFPNAFI